MTHTDNMTVLFQHPYERLPSPHCNFNHPRSQPWPSHPDLPGFMYNIGTSLHESFPLLPQKLQGQEFETSPVLDQIVYPSPPPTSSQPKRSVPLPSVIGGAPSNLTTCQAIGGILDSPLVMHHNALKFHTPLSPPPTIPIQTLALPSTDSDPSSDLVQDQSNSSLQVSPRAVAISNRPDMVLQLLSPLSPELQTTRISDSPVPPKDCVLLSNPEGEQGRSSGAFDYSPELPVDGPSTGRPFLPLLEIPRSHDIPDYPWDHDTLDPPTMDVDREDPPSSSHPQILNTDSGVFDDDYVINTTFPHPSSPLIHSLQPLPDLDDIPPSHSPESPSLRSFTSLPDLDIHDDDDLFHSPLSSPGQQLLSLPGADTDDDLLPADLAPSSFIPELFPFVPSSPSSRSLLLLDDPNDIPPPRSPSPENFDIDLSAIGECSDPDLQKLIDLRNRSQAAERSARQVEAQMLERGAVHMRAEVRRVKKREKERSREISALLRLKLGDRIVVASTDEQRRGRSPKKMIASMAELVARMNFRRHDTFRPLANRKPVSPSHHYAGSPLSRSIDMDFTGEDSQSNHLPQRPLEFDNSQNLNGNR